MSTQYIVPGNNTAEITRLLQQDRLLVEAQGGRGAEQKDPCSFKRILDLACGPAGSILDAAGRFPETQFVGVDISPTMIAYAEAEASIRQLPNASFLQADITDPLPFQDNTFDLVNARLISSILCLDCWEPLLQECQRILRKGAVMRLTECETPRSSSCALDHLATWQKAALKRANKNPSTAICLVPWLRQTGYQNIKTRAFAIEWSAGSPAHEAMVSNTLLWYQFIAPFLQEQGIATQDELEHCLADLREELWKPDFAGLWYFCTAWGTKPE